MIKRINWIPLTGLILLITCGFTCNKQAFTNQKENNEIMVTNEKNTNVSTVQGDLKIGTNVGNIAPDIEMNSPDGKTYKLSDLRGQIVLIDFWASWCKPCRMENPVVVEAYEKYKNAKFSKGKGFTIYSVSLDRSGNAWKKAINEDNLTWKYHVSDLKFWNNKAAVDYNIRAIPNNYLIDKDGVILAKNLRGISLHQKLDEYLQKR